MTSQNDLPTIAQIFNKFIIQIHKQTNINNFVYKLHEVQFTIQDLVCSVLYGK